MRFVVFLIFLVLFLLFFFLFFLVFLRGSLSLAPIPSLASHKPAVFNSYGQCRATGSFIIVDEQTNNTVGAAMIIGETS